MSSNVSQISAKDVSLGEFLKLLILELDEQKVPMPFQNEEKWHRLFYKLKTARGQEGRSPFLDRLRFDWDGSYPKSQDLSEFLQTLHLNGFVSVANPTYDRLNVDQDVMNGADQIRPAVEGEDFEKFLRFSIKTASDLFS